MLKSPVLSEIGCSAIKKWEIKKLQFIATADAMAWDTAEKILQHTNDDFVPDMMAGSAYYEAMMHF